MIQRRHQLVRADVLEGRPVRTGRPSRLWVLLLLTAAGCGWLQPPPDAGGGSPSGASLGRIESQLQEAETPEGRQLAMTELLSEFGLTPLAGGAAPFDARRYALGPQETWLGGFIPGRHPVLRSELVLVRAASEDLAAGRLLEAARVLVERSQTENLPGRSVLVAFYADSTQRLARSLWPAASVHARVELVQSGRGTQATVVWPGSEARAEYSAADSLEPVAELNQLIELLVHVASPSDTLGVELPSHAKPELE